jgi:thiamine pyrophosphate-dependent acetolactate synthase large subunit-like protein
VSLPDQASSQDQVAGFAATLIANLLMRWCAVARNSNAKTGNFVARIAIILRQRLPLIFCSGGKASSLCTWSLFQSADHS